MMKILTILIIILLLCCKSNYKNVRNTDDILDINIQDIHVTNNDTTLVRDVEYVFLETNKNCLIGNISKILYQNRRFYILDKFESKAIFVFNKKGDFLYKIDKTGKGPGEYLELRDFDIDKEGNIYLYDNNAMKIIKYFADSEKFKEFKVKYRFEEFKMIDDEKMFVYNLYEKGKISAIFAIYRIKNRKLITIIPGRKLYDDFDNPRFNSSFLLQSSDNLFFSPVFSNEIYKVSEEKVTKIIRFDKSLIPSKEYIFDLKKNYQLIYMSDRYITNIGNIYENTKFITMTIQKKLPYTCLISKKTGKKVLNIIFKNRYYLEGDIFIHGIADDKFLSYIPTSKFIENSWINEVKNSSLNEEIKNKLLSLNAQSNPVIVLFDINDF